MLHHGQIDQEIFHPFTARRIVRDIKKNHFKSNRGRSEKKVVLVFQGAQSEGTQTQMTCMVESPGESSYCTCALFQKALFQYARQRRDKPHSFWSRGIRSDETKSELYGQRDVIKAYSEGYTIPTVQHGAGSHTVWNCVSM